MVAPADASVRAVAMGGDAEDGGGGGGGGRPRIPPTLPTGDCRWCRMEWRWAPLVPALLPAEPPPPLPDPRAAIVAVCDDMTTTSGAKFFKSKARKRGDFRLLNILNDIQRKDPSLIAEHMVAVRYE